MGENSAAITNKDVIAFVKSTGFEFPPGTDYEYSNSGYVVLSEIISKISGQSFSRYIETNFFGPLEMTNSWVSDGKERSRASRAIGYNADHSVNDYRNLTTGAGGIYSSKEDLMKWYNAIRDSALLRKSTWTLAFRPPEIPGKRTYLAMGWNYEDCGAFDQNIYAVSSFGSLNGFKAYLFMVPSLDFAIIALSNSNKDLVSPYEILEIFYND